MCEDQPAGARPFPRRRLLQGMVAVAALAGCRAEPARPAAQAAGAAPRPFRLGMHLHASASEGTGSMRSQLAEAAANGFDVAWFTEHDWRRRRLLFRPEYHFLPDEESLGGVWTLPRLPDLGTPTADSGGWQVADPVSPADPAARKGSLRLRATSRGDDDAAVRYRVASERTSRMNYRARLAGRTLSVDVLPVSGGPDAWGEVELTLSHHPGSGTRPAGVISLRYRLRPDLGAPAASTEGSTAVVDLPVRAGQWQTVTFPALADLSAAWPDLDPRDNALTDIRFSAASRRRATAEVFFGFLRLEEQAGYDGLGVEQDLVAAYAAQEPGVLGLVGTEISLGPHLNQFGGVQAPYDYGPVRGLKDTPGRDIVPAVVGFVHAHGGLASINHPAAAPTATMSAAQVIALELLAVRAGGADLLEVGYGYGGLGTMPDHLAVWDTLSRNGLFLTGNGVSDDHTGQGWANAHNRYYTAAWARKLDEPALLDALAAGRAFAGYLGAFGGTLDMSMDGAVPMGAVAVGPRSSRVLRVDVTGLPAGGAVQVVRGDVDRAGTARPDPGTRVARTLGARDLAARPEIAVDTSDDCFHRLQVVDRDGDVVAFGQPIWTLTSTPPDGVPAARRPAT